MDISNIYLKKQIVLKYLHKTRLKLVGLEINKGIKNEQRKLLTNISWNIFVELHVGGADPGTGTTGLINGSKARQLEIAETSVKAVHKFPK